MKIQEVEALKQAILDKKKSYSENELRIICREFDRQYIYESTSFENGDFSFEDIVFLLEDHSRQFPDKSENVRKAIINNYHAIQQIHKLSEAKTSFDET
ncbi:MAG: hypothetical protein KAU02_06450, partial [Tenericutes bacterium]|nr:hypothetical protein [Mycoplasmatota bacterium]